MRRSVTTHTHTHADKTQKLKFFCSEINFIGIVSLSSPFYFFYLFEDKTNGGCALKSKKKIKEEETPAANGIRYAMLLAQSLDLQRTLKKKQRQINSKNSSNSS